MADAATLNAASEVILALDYLKQGKALIADVMNTLKQDLSAGAILAVKQVDPSLPSAIVAEMNTIMGKVQALYVDLLTNHGDIIAWVPGQPYVDPNAPAPAPVVDPNAPTS